MKNRGYFFAAVVLTLTLSHSALAGVIHTPVASPPPGSESATAGGEIPNGVAGQMDTPKAAGDIHTTVTTSDSVFEAALNLLRGVLALF